MSDYYYKKRADGLIDPPENTPELLEEQQQIWDYIPLVRRIAKDLTPHCNLSYRDLCQQGYYILAELTFKIDWLDNRKRISSYVSRSLSGLMKNYIGKRQGVISLPGWKPGYYEAATVCGLEDTAPLMDDSMNSEEKLLLEERKEQMREAITVVLPSLTEREHYVLFSCMVTDDPTGYREIGDQFNCTKDSIYRDVKRITGKLKEILDEDLET